MDAVTGSGLEVVGVAVDANTVIVARAADGTFSTIALADIATNDYLEVYVVPRNDDSVLATRIVRKVEDSVNKVELRVKVRSVDTTAKTFTHGLGTHTVNYAGAEVRGNIADGAMLRVKGERSGLTITAERVRTGDGSNDDTNNGRKAGKIELEGIISDLDSSAKTFKILDFVVQYSSAEVKGNLTDGAWVEVEGRVDSATSAIVAREVKLEGKWDDSDDDSNDDNGGNDDGDDNGNDDSNDDNSGDDSNDDNGGADGEFEITASVSSFDATSNSFMLGSTKVTVLATTEYKNVANDNISSSEFWGANRNGALVKAEGAKQDGVLVARQVKLC